MRRPRPYTWAAPAYDRLSLERPVYRVGRVAGIEALGLRWGDRVLDVGCGTGLSFPLLRSSIGPSGRVVGVDSSPEMVQQARRRVEAHGWENVELVVADATTLGDRVGRTPSTDSAPTRHMTGSFDAAIFVYSLSLMRAWQRAWDSVLPLVRPGGRVAVVDMATPGGWARVWTPLAHLATRAGGADIDAHPWTALERDLTQVQGKSLRGGHLQVRAGTVPSHEKP